MAATAECDAADGRNVAVVATYGNRNMFERGRHVVGRIEVDPAQAVAVEGNPGVRGVGAGELGLARGRDGVDVAAHVARGNAKGTEGHNLQVRKILADAAALF